MRRILITGGAGSIGTGYARWASGRYEITLLDLPGQFSAEHHQLGRVVEGDLGSLASISGAFDGIDTVIHLGGERYPWAQWDTLLPANIVGTYNMVVAAISSRCKRIVYASSVHAVSGYPEGSGIPEAMPVRPGDLYGVTKCFGEALGSFVTHTEDISFVALRIGAFREPASLASPDSGWMLQDYTAPEDLYSQLDVVIEAEGLGFEIFNAVSGNTFSRLPMEKARAALDFTPRYDSFQLSPPFRSAIEAVGGVADRVVESGMRDDLERISRSKEIV